MTAPAGNRAPRPGGKRPQPAGETGTRSPYGKLLEIHIGIKSTTGQPTAVRELLPVRRGHPGRPGRVGQIRATVTGSAGAAGAGADPVRVVDGTAGCNASGRNGNGLLRHAVDAFGRRTPPDRGASCTTGSSRRLTGLTYAMDAARLGQPDEAQRAELISTTATGLRSSIGSLRSLLVDHLSAQPRRGGPRVGARRSGGQFGAQGHRRAARHRGRGRAVAGGVGAAVPRAAQESGTQRPSHTAVPIVATISGRAPRRTGRAWLIDDDGRGFDIVELDERAGDGPTSACGRSVTCWPGRVVACWCERHPGRAREWRAEVAGAMMRGPEHVKLAQGVDEPSYWSRRFCSVISGVEIHKRVFALPRWNFAYLVAQRAHGDQLRSRTSFGRHIAGRSSPVHDEVSAVEIVTQLENKRNSRSRDCSRRRDGGR